MGSSQPTKPPYGIGALRDDPVEPGARTDARILRIAGAIGRQIAREHFRKLTAQDNLAAVEREKKAA